MMAIAAKNPTVFNIACQRDITEMERVKFVLKGGTVVRNDLSPRGAPSASR